MEIAVNGWFAGDAASGSGQYIDHLLTHLPQVERRARISLLVPAGRSAAGDGWPAVDVVRLPLPPLPQNLAKLWFEQVSVPLAARRLGADVLWVPYWAAPWWQPVPTVVTVHDLIPLLLKDYRKGMLQRAYTGLVSRTARRASAVIAVSEAAKADIVADLHIPAERVHPILHGPNQEGSPPPTPEQMAAVRARYNLPPRFFLYLGGFDVRKNLAGTLAA